MKEGYRLGRSNLNSYALGIEKEWLLTNGIGGFAGMSVIGAQTRLQSAYLVASLCPPVERRVILSNIHERLEDGGCETDLASQRYLSRTREGFRYLNAFKLDILPEYIYQINDFCFTKTIGLVHGRNEVFVNYDVKAGRQGGRLIMTPLFNYRDYCGVSHPRDLQFDVEDIPARESRVFKSSALLTPACDKGRHIVFASTEGSFADRGSYETSMACPTYLMEENSVYDIDVRNGFNGVDNHFTPIDVAVELGPYERKRFTLAAAVYEGTSEDAAAYMEGMLSWETADTSHGEKASCAEADGELTAGAVGIHISGPSCTYGTDSGGIGGEQDMTAGERLARHCRQRIYRLMDRADSDDVFVRRLAWAADSFIAERRSTGLKTLLAGYPHFSDWGRDTMIALTGLTLCTGRSGDCRSILLSFAKYVENGLVPNMFPNSAGEKPLYNTMDASLWYIYAVGRYIDYTGDHKFVSENLYESMKQIIDSYMRGTDFSIHMDKDGLIAGGGGLDQITWMDVRVGRLVVTPRHGKPVEVNALWYNALMVMQELASRIEPENAVYAQGLKELAARVRDSFVHKFWNGEKRCLFDVIGQDGSADASIRPNQIYAVSLPYTMLSRAQERQVVDCVYGELYTPLGIRSLSHRDERYKRRYIGKLMDRDLAYHMGTSWGYISGAFITAYLKVHDYSPEAAAEAREMLECFADHLNDGCLNSIAEIFDGDAPSTGRGCYAQAWSVGEVLRAYMELCSICSHSSYGARK